jgi:hypothetical protein
VHKANVVACVRIQAHRQAKRECRTFATTTDGLRALLTWLSTPIRNYGDVFLAAVRPRGDRILC